MNGESILIGKRDFSFDETLGLRELREEIEAGVVNGKIIFHDGTRPVTSELEVSENISESGTSERVINKVFQIVKSRLSKVLRLDS